LKPQTHALAPTAAAERLPSLDFLRGIAVLGILILNIQTFAMIESAYLNPTANAELTGLNRWIWIFSYLFGDQKFMTLFSLLFGAGIVLFSNRAQSKGQSAAALHYRRVGWLLIFGLIHAYVFWYGDILVPYALCALLIFLLRNVGPWKLFILGLIVLSVSSGLYFLSGYSLPYWPQEAYQGVMQAWQPSTELIENEIQAMRGGWLEQMSKRVPASFYFQTFIFFFWSFWRVSGLMLIGMALFKWGILSAQRSRRFYVWMSVIGLGIGLPLVAFGIIKKFEVNWLMDYAMFFGMQYNYWGSLLVSAGYIGIIMLISRSEGWQGFREPFMAVGKMAFSNYFMQTIICTFLFYGHGLGLFERVNRLTHILIVLTIWILQLLFSTWWLKRFRFGPLEWLWRSLTYWSFQPLRR
jgi:uncharacterized protein